MKLVQWQLVELRVPEYHQLLEQQAGPLKAAPSEHFDQKLLPPNVQECPTRIVFELSVFCTECEILTLIRYSTARSGLL